MWIVVRIILCFGHLVLSHVGSDDRVAVGDVVEPVENVLCAQASAWGTAASR